MIEIVTQAFSWICGQHADHTWTCGGLPLPCCQRCTGLYLGALAGFLLLILLRPPMTRLLLWLHGAMLILMVPFGFHWLPQDALIRGWTGVLFGFGLVAFLQLPLAQRTTDSHSSSSRATRVLFYCIGLATTLAAIAVLHFGAPQISAALVSLFLLCGALVLITLAVANIWLGIRRLVRVCMNAHWSLRTCSPAMPPRSATKQFIESDDAGGV
jgi:uncharacterized membrane protein